jgi:hypothetical protein
VAVAESASRNTALELRRLRAGTVRLPGRARRRAADRQAEAVRAA